MVCMLVLVRSKAQSTVAGSRPDTRLHSMETFNLEEEKEASGASARPSTARCPDSLTTRRSWSQLIYREKLSPDVTAEGACEGMKPFRLRLTTVITSLPPS